MCCSSASPPPRSRQRCSAATQDQIISALSNAWIDGGALRALPPRAQHRPAQIWAAGDATSRGVRLALMAMQGEMGYPSALTAKNWGFYDVLFKGKPFILGGRSARM